MINYSIAMRSVNANLLAINPGKATHQPGKVTHQPGKEGGQGACEGREKFAKHITSHGSVYSRADISAILYMAVISRSGHLRFPGVLQNHR